jgi:hypothetical protein
MRAVDEIDLRDLDLKDISDAQPATLVQVLDDDGESTTLMRCLECELDRPKRRGTLQ